ncbi:nitroreductase family protein [Lentilactobacillus kosonis]|uniref:Oxygen-insensitive NADPH nitroreductase n=1 Tax=Lentilactobacillus kosonis TaxID=2810561 RepID=A0A401FJA3_9LACO|nr:nitroreductase family protein [Lentilactobacillus kosonis]GAY72368.1 oxygen-insensitive NADPH nitroreductase [Lentilactobacillus kosonis]
MENSVLDLIYNHRSIRNFKKQALSSEEVQTLIMAASKASNSTFSQQYSIISVTDPEKLQAFDELTGSRHWMMSSGHYFVMVADQQRNFQIAQKAGVDPYILRTTDKFLASVFDASIATENLVLAAESMGMGATIMGSILNDSHRVIELLNLPKLTFPLLGVAVGYPETLPENKPRLPQTLQHFENGYHLSDRIENQLPEYDQQMLEYYAARSSNQREETFSNHIVSELSRNRKLRSDLLKNIVHQGFNVDELLK